MSADNTNGSGNDSFNCVNLIIDGPIDNEIRPCRPEFLPRLRAEREKIARYEAMMKKRKARKKQPPGQAKN